MSVPCTSNVRCEPHIDNWCGSRRTGTGTPAAAAAGGSGTGGCDSGREDRELENRQFLSATGDPSQGEEAS
ncbi:hypothetical protein CesoFtcFv8_011718 [Champsocephalus esox]|uniref:Uncharacterized protein n=1 Tax=Champsocephalus esox TaxID=159716 RepID=A0AAN8C307_9TELE|nr:hypothetical protein CesoFtcFv8_011718 [Champsocephalus esox]